MMQAMLELLQRAEEAIENEDEICFDVAANVGQIFGNVKHMTWFRDAVAEELDNDTTARCECKADFTDGLPYCQQCGLPRTVPI